MKTRRLPPPFLAGENYTTKEEDNGYIRKERVCINMLSAKIIKQTEDETQTGTWTLTTSGQRT